MSIYDFDDDDGTCLEFFSDGGISISGRGNYIEKEDVLILFKEMKKHFEPESEKDREIEELKKIINNLKEMEKK